MIDLDFVERLIRALDESSLDSLELERGGTRIRLSKSSPSFLPGEASGPSRHAAHPGPTMEVPPVSASRGSAPGQSADAPAPETPEKKYIEVTSPMVGTFYRAPSPDSPPYVERGTRVGEGTVLCIIEAMKLMNEMESEVTGTVAEILVENAEPVEYGQVLTVGARHAPDTPLPPGDREGDHPVDLPVSFCPGSALGMGVRSASDPPPGLGRGFFRGHGVSSGG